ncbi:MAG: DUF3575 domain-containing protein [Prolixibacteraceae bacterium]|nr:DUF3575 domain-containing protein [Prolixibacteraceae bacterium]
MKKSLLIILLFVAATGFSQNNAVKFSLSGANFGAYSLAYEHALNEKSSLNLTLGYWTPNNGIFTFSEDFYIEDRILDESIWIGELYTGYHFSLDYRIHPAGEGLKGFYWGPYARYWNLGFKLRDRIDENYFDINSSFSGLGLGVQIGYQWVIAKIVTIDWYFLGLGAQSFNANGDYVVTPDQANFDYEAIIPDVVGGYERVPYIANNVKTEVFSDRLNLQIPIILPDIRMGLSVGIAF